MDTENLPAIGTPEAAVHAVESLIHRAICPQLEPLQLRYWLDAYYQVRRAADAGRTAAERCSALREDEEGARAMLGPAEGKTEEPPAPVKAKRQKPVGWTDGNQVPTDPATYSAASAAVKFKRELYERLQRFLREGVTMQQIVQAAEGEINEDQILGIRECKRVPVAAYRILAAALDRIETD